MLTLWGHKILSTACLDHPSCLIVRTLRSKEVESLSQLSGPALNSPHHLLPQPKPFPFLLSNTPKMSDVGRGGMVLAVFPWHQRTPAGRHPHLKPALLYRQEVCCLWSWRLPIPPWPLTHQVLHLPVASDSPHSGGSCLAPRPWPLGTPPSAP